MKKLLFVTLNYSYSPSMSGINKKIWYQYTAFQNLGYDVSITGKKDGKFHIYDTSYETKVTPFLKDMIRVSRLLIRYVQKEHVDVVYVRYEHFSGPSFLNFCKEVKKRGIRLIVEIPTYPYDAEYTNKLRPSYGAFLLDQRYRGKLHHTVDAIATFSDDQTIFGVPCINITNGISLEYVQPIIPKAHEGLYITSVSTCDVWHGIDRFLEALDRYYQKGGTEKIYFHIAGKGKETPKLQAQVEKSKYLKQYVVFHGFLKTPELDELYNMTDIAVGGLGDYRKNLLKTHALKHREYCAKGIPFIYATEDDCFEGSAFTYKVPNDDTQFEIEEIVEWYQALSIDSEKIRAYAQKFTWEEQLKKVLKDK